MLETLKNHPFAVEAYFERSLVLTFAIPKEALETFIPECLSLDTFEDKWAFIAIAMVQTQGLRPKGFPKFIGNDFFLIGYRIFVRYLDQRGKRLRGLYIIKSETNKWKMQFFGNLFTHYNYTTTDIDFTIDESTTEVRSQLANLKVTIQEKKEVRLPDDSPFQDWKAARRFAGPLPFTFTYNKVKKEVLIIEGVRQNWKPQPVEVVNYHFNYLDQLNLNGIKLANAFIIKNIPYYWKKGKIEKWQR